MGCLCFIWNSNGISHRQRNKAAAIKAAGVRVVMVAVMFLMSMVGPAIMGRWLRYRRPIKRAQHSAPLRQSPSCSSCTATTEFETVCQAESSCRFVINSLWLTVISFFLNHVDSHPNTTHRLSWPPLRRMSVIRSAVLTQPRQGSRKRLEAHTAMWNRMLRWNKRCSGCQRTTSWDQISHYLPHKPSWPEAKVRQAGGHSWVQKLNHPSSKWTAFDQACHFCHKGDLHDQTISTGQSL